jgi:hypothetical protein
MIFGNYKTGLRPKQKRSFGHKSGFIEKLPTEKVWAKPKKSGLLATFKTKVGLRKPSIHAGLRAFCPLSHFFLLFNCDKKFNIYI